MKRISKDEYYLGIALAVSKRSTCLKRHYGCVIVKNDEIIATGYNGSPRGTENCCDRGTCHRADIPHNTGNYSECCSVHAEQNAMLSADRSKLIGATLYLACEEYQLDKNESAKHEDEIYNWLEVNGCAPCPICGRMIKNAGITSVINTIGELVIQCL